MGSGKNLISGRTNYSGHKGYREFVKKHPKTEIDYKTYSTVIKKSNEKIRDYILTNLLGFKLPSNLGYIAVSKIKPKYHHKLIDWPATNRLGKVIPLTNLHTFGYTYKICFYKNTRYSPLRIFNFKAHRLLKRMLANHIKTKNQDYLHLDSSYFNKRFNIDNYLKEK